MLEELVAKRTEVAAKAVKVTDFRVIVRGGKFTKLAHCVAFDSIRSEALPGTPSDFCVLYRLAKSDTFSINLYGENICLCLASGWASRLQHMFDVWVRSVSILQLPSKLPT